MKTHTVLRLVVMMLTLMVLVAIGPATRSVRTAGPWYVAPGGNNGSGCSSPAAPCATINGAIGKATSGDTIYVATGTYFGTGDQVVLLDKSVTLSGGWNSAFTVQSSTSTIDGQGARRALVVNSGASATVERFTVQNGYALCNNCARNGGGILNNGSLTLSRNLVIANTAGDWGGGILNAGLMTINDTIISRNFGGGGGGIGNYDGTLTLNRSTITDNYAASNGDGGGGISNPYGGTIVLNNSTVSKNSSAATGGGIRMQWGALNLNNATISDNATVAHGGGVYNYGGTVTMQNTIIGANSAEYSPDCANGGYLNTSGYNLIGNTLGCNFAPGTGDLTNVSPNLGPLIGAPGAPQYHPLLPGSPAIDAGNPSGCTGSTGPLATDQRGANRVGRCDIGAYEYTAPGPAANVYAFGGTPQSAPPFKTYTQPLQALVLDAMGSPVTNTSTQFSAPTHGASGTFSNTGTYTTTATTAATGIATALTYTANGLTGTYTVTATVRGVVTPANFVLTNMTWYVTPTGNDNSNCASPSTPCATINGALNKSSFVGGGTVLVSVGAYTGGTTEVVLLNKDATLIGGWDTAFTVQSGMSTIDAQEARRGVTVDRGVAAIIERFAIQQGWAQREPAWPKGGGIRNDGILTLNSSSISDNTGPQGAGIYNGGTLIMNRSTVNGNTTMNDGVFYGSGGGIYNEGALTLNNSTISENTSANSGAIVNEDHLQLNNSTVSNNTGGIGGGTIILRNTIIAGNSGWDCSSGTSAGYNLLGNTCSGITPSTGDLINVVDPRLGALEGKPGHHPLLQGSPAINAGNPNGCMDHLGNPLPADQRGVARVGRCDIGAYEVTPFEFSTKTVTPTTALRGDPVTYTISLNNSAPFTVTNVRVTDTLPITLTYIDNSLAATSGSYGFASGAITWTGVVSVSKSVTITFGAKVIQTALMNALVTNTVMISDDWTIRAPTAGFRIPPAFTFLPCVYRDYCAGFIDDFSNSASGWEVGEDAFVRSEYLGGEFRVLTKQSGYYYLFQAPSCKIQNYIVEADARWVGTPGNRYGLIFGITADYNQYYLFAVNTDHQQYWLLRRAWDGWSTIASGGSLAINMGTASNHLKATRRGNDITLEINGTVLGTWFDSTISGLTDAGIVSNPYSDIPVSDARFDNFSVTTLPSD